MKNSTLRCVGSEWGSFASRQVCQLERRFPTLGDGRRRIQTCIFWDESGWEGKKGKKGWIKKPKLLDPSLLLSWAVEAEFEMKNTYRYHLNKMSLTWLLIWCRYGTFCRSLFAYVRCYKRTNRYKRKSWRTIVRVVRFDTSKGYTIFNTLAGSEKAYQKSKVKKWNF